MSMAKRMYISLKKQATPQSMIISGNLPVPVTLPSTAIACTVTARKEGRKEKYVYRYLNCIVVGY